jgi:Fuc2NAc and GlcNAc transferase
MQVLDTPDHRSSHDAPTPHGGGVALIGAFLLVLAVAAANARIGAAPWGLLGGVALAFALLGIVDDLRGLSVRLRLSIQVLLCLVTAAWIVLQTGGASGIYAAVLTGVGAFALVTMLNFFNFMDGIDGIAASQAVLACCAAAFLGWQPEGVSAYSLVCALLAASHLGFLVWNRPPAKLFMGDAGSVPTGYLLAALALFGELSGLVSAAAWLVLLALFIADAGWTLAWRMATGQAFTQPHREHAYQRLSRHWQSHLRVDLVLVGVNVFWLYPIAWAVQYNPRHALFLVILAYVPLLACMAKFRRLH